MKKLRGKKRFFNLCRKKIYALNLNFSSWFDYWHTHIDWEGYGNHKGKYFNEFVSILLGAISLYQEKLSKNHKEFQCFGILDLLDSGSTAIYIHTPNPNSDNFPIKFDSDLIDISVPIQINHIPATNHFVFKKSKTFPNIIYVFSRFGD